MRRFLCWVVCFALQMSLAGQGMLEPLEPFKWKNRVIIVDCDRSTAQRFISEFSEARAGVVDRDVVWFVMYGERFTTNYGGDLSSSFAIVVRELLPQRKESMPSVVLVGKDGGIKSIETELDLGRIFDRIDAMPMRRAEMREID